MKVLEILAVVAFVATIVGAFLLFYNTKQPVESVSISTKTSVDTVFVRGKDSIVYRTKYVYLEPDSAVISGDSVVVSDSSYKLQILAYGKVDSIAYSIAVRRDSVFVDRLRVDSVFINRVDSVFIDRTREVKVLDWKYMLGATFLGIALGIAL